MIFYISAVLGADMPLAEWEAMYETVPPMLSSEERANWLKKLDKVALASDAFFPFRDNVDRAVQVLLTCVY